MNGMNCYFLFHFQLLAMFNTIVGAASRYGSGSDQMMRLLAPCGSSSGSATLHFLNFKKYFKRK
jgi:hypothetical protein